MNVQEITCTGFPEGLFVRRLLSIECVLSCFRRSLVTNVCVCECICICICICQYSSLVCISYSCVEKLVCKGAGRSVWRQLEL